MGAGSLALLLAGAAGARSPSTAPSGRLGRSAGSGLGHRSSRRASLHSPLAPVLGPQPQALKLDDDAAREAATLASLHAALQYAVTGAVQFHSIQCVVLCVFTLHCCRGRGTPEQKAQRQGWHAQLSDALPAGDKAKWAAVGWVDPRLESHATQVGPRGLPGRGAVRWAAAAALTQRCGQAAAGRRV